MSVQLSAPVPGWATTTFLPNPTFGDSESADIELDVSYAMDGTRRTYVTTADEKELVWTFRLTREKSLELQAFITNYFASKIYIRDHNNEEWEGYFLDNPFEFSGARRWKTVREEVGVTLQFQAVRKL